MDVFDPLPPLAVLAGGLATRMRPLTAEQPKALLPVAGRPFVLRQLELAARQGVRDVVLCVGHLGHMIEAVVGDGAGLGIRVRYARDGETPRGTGGALRAAAPLLGDHFLAMYGDSYLPTDWRRIWRAYQRCGLPAMLAVYRNCGQWDRSNVHWQGGRVLRYDKSASGAEMEYIDYGMAVLASSLLQDYPERFDIGALYAGTAAAGQLGAVEVRERFFEIGSPAGLFEAEAMFSGEEA